MDGMSWFLLGVLTGVFITIACVVAAFCKRVEGLNEQGEHDDG